MPGFLDFDRRRARRRRQLGDAARDARDWTAAAAAYRAYLVLRPADWGLRVQLGHALKESGDIAGAEAAYREAARIAPQDADIHLQIGHLMKVAGRYDEARAAYARSASLEPGGQAAAELLAMTSPAGAVTRERSLGDSARDARNWREAARNYRAHLEQAPDDWPIWVQLGNMLKELGDLGGAEKAYHTAIGYDSAVADTYLQLGHVLKLAGKREAALEAYRLSAELDANSEARTELSLLGVALPEPVQEASKASYETVLRARAARDQGRIDEAAALYRHHLAIDPTEWEIWFELALVLRGAGRLHEAYDAVEHAAARSAGTVMPILREQASLLLLLGRLEASQALFMRVVQQTGSAEMFEAQGLNIRL